MEGRYSFSLTTFHPSGTLPQLSHAARAATLGPPIIAVSLKIKQDDGEEGGGKEAESVILLASLQSLPSPLIQDDATPRFVPITTSPKSSSSSSINNQSEESVLLLAHTGISADGRVLSQAAQRLAVEHAYTFQESIPIHIFLEEMALLMQEYTMKPGSRPFGCSLLICHLSNTNNSSSEGRMYRIDPSGSVTEVNKVAYLGRGNGDEIVKRLHTELSLNTNTITSVEEKSSLAEVDTNQEKKIVNTSQGGEDVMMSKKAEETLIKILCDEMKLSPTCNEGKLPLRQYSSVSLICTILSGSQGCVTKRIPFYAGSS